jgi:hypothetical protein
VTNGQNDLYDLLTARIAPYASEDGTIHFDRIARAPVDDETIGLVAQGLVHSDPETRKAALFIFAGLQDESPERLEPFRPLEKQVRSLLLDTDSSVRCDALMAYAYFDPEDLGGAVHEFLGDPSGRNRIQAVRILATEGNPENLPTLLTLGFDPYHEASEKDLREWLVVREAAREAIERLGAIQFPETLDEEEVSGVPCLFHAWDPVWQWAARSRVKPRG